MANLSNINNKFLVTTGGDVGIGVTNPGQKLTVQGSSTAAAGRFTAGGNTNTLELFGSSTTGQSSGLLVNAGTNTADYAARFRNAAGSVMMNIRGDGNVGIGTISPAEKLEVSGSVRVGNMKFEPAAGGRIGFNRNTSNGVIYDSNYAAFQINGAYSGADYLEIQNYASTGGFLGSLSFKGGLVGIGTNNPQTKLEVSGGLVKIVESGETAFYGGDYVRVFGTQSYGFRNSGGSSIALISLNGNTYFNGGNVGIGTASPSSEISSSVTMLEINDASNNNLASLALKAGTASSKWEMAALSSNALGFIRAGTERFRIDNVGSVYNSASSGTVTKYGYNALNGTSFTGDESSAFGTNALGSSTSGRNHAFGFRALQDLTTGGYNTAVGGESIENNIDGSYNTGVGAFTLRVLTTASYNTGVGAHSLYYSNNNYNTGYGYRAGYGITTGARNVALGSSAMESVGMTGDDNVAIGHQAMFSLGNASQNVVIGNYAGDALDTGANNVAVGYKALSNATTQSNNVAIGRTAMQVSSCFNSIAIGNDALEGASGGYNIAIGTFTGRVVSSGVSNVLVGYSSGYDLTTGSYNVCIGDRTGRLLFAGAENTLIGHQTGYNLNGGDYNTCVGFKNLFQASSGQFNTSLGFAALNKYTGDFSVAVGAYALFTCTSGERNTAVGYQALFALNTGIDNTAVGQMALQNVTNGNYNVGVGYLAGVNINSGEFNVAVGRSSLGAVTSGSYNIGIGYDAFQAVSTSGFNTGVGGSVGVYQTGNYNTAIGYFSQYGISGGSNGSYNTTTGYFAGAYNTGENNAFFGALAGRFNKGGSRNTIVGSQACDNRDITGSDNTIMGFTAAQNLTSGYENTFIGKAAGQSSGLTGAGNIGIGINALNATSGSSNIAIGYNSMRGNVVTGSHNTCVGDASGNEITSGTNNTFIGKDSGRSNSPSGVITSQSNRVVLGDNSVTHLYCKTSTITTSDRRDKGKFEDIELGLDFVNKLKPTAFEFKIEGRRDTEETDGIKRYGFIAQDILELEKDNPVIIDNSRPDNLLYNQGNLIPILVKAIQELKAEIDVLKSK